MKTITLIVRHGEIGKFFPDGARIVLDDDASALDTVRAMDEKIKEKCGKFPVKGFESLLQMVYHPYECRVYKQVAIQAYTMSKPFINVRDNLKMSLPNDTTLILIPQGGCTTDWEEPIK